MVRFFTCFSFVVVTSTIITGCNLLSIGFTDIREVVNKPAQYEGKEIRIRGKVVGVNKIPLINIKSYVVQDTTGEVSVTTNGQLPTLNEPIALEVSVENNLIIGTESFGLKVKELKRLPAM